MRQLTGKAMLSIAILALTSTLLFPSRPCQAKQPAPIIFADGIVVFTSEAGFNKAASAVCDNINQVVFDSIANQNNPATTLYGDTSDGQGVTFTSTSLLTGQNGQHKINGPFSNITLTPTLPGGKFEVLQFNVKAAHGSDGEDVTLVLSGGDTITQVLDPGNTFFGIIAPNGITSADIASLGWMTDIQQVSVCEHTDETAVPEPSATSFLALSSVGLAGILFVGNRRHNKRVRISQ